MTHADFELAIQEEPDESAHYAAYGDWLHERGHPRGDFIQVQLALEDGSRSPTRREGLRERELELLARHEHDWLGPLAPVVVREGNRYRWARGFLHSLGIGQLSVADGRALRDAAAARFLRELVIEDEAAADENEQAINDDLPEGWREGWEPFLGLQPVLQAPISFPCLRVFRIGPEPEIGEGRGWADCWTYCHDLPALVLRMPLVEELHLYCKRYDVERLFASPCLTRLRLLRVHHLGEVAW